MESNNGKGLFYGVVGVATLIVAIIGATFAWFTATAGAQTEKEIIRTGTLLISYTEGTLLKAENLKPATQQQVTAAYNTGNCKHAADVTDSINNEPICAVYSFTVENTGSLTAILNASASNFTITDLSTNRVDDGLATAVTKEEEITNGYFKYIILSDGADIGDAAVSNSLANASNLTLSNATLTPGNSSEYHVVVWLDENAGNSYQSISVSAKFGVVANQTNYVQSNP